MKRQAISIHSSRGGTGKTVIATNLAGILASKGRNVALIDVDFRAPSLITIFSQALDTKVEYWVNDFLNGNCSGKQILFDITKKYPLKGKLQIGFANPSIEAIRSVMDKSARWEVAAVKKLTALIKSFYNDLGIDYFIFDTSPGVQYSSLNALAGSDLSLIVTSLDMVDLQGTKRMLKEIYEVLNKKNLIILNKYTPEQVISEFSTQTNIESMLNSPVIAKIPCYCEVLQTQRRGLLSIQKPDHPFVKALEEVVHTIDSM